MPCEETPRDRRVRAVFLTPRKGSKDTHHYTNPTRINMNSAPTITITLPQSAIGAVAGMRPEWLRIPRDKTHCPLTGLSRMGYYRLIKSGNVETKKLAEGKGGVVLVRAASLLSAIERIGPGPASPPSPVV